MANEFRVNSYTSDSQSHPDVISMADGGFLIVWDSIIFQDPLFNFNTHYVGAQRFDANGVRVGTEDFVDGGRNAASHNPRAVLLQDGGYAITYSYSDDGTFGANIAQVRVFNANGTERTTGAVDVDPRAAEFTNAAHPVALADGGFMVFHNVGRTISGIGNLDVYATRFDAQGVAVGGDVLVNTTVRRFQQANVQITELTGGRFIAAWSSEGSHAGGRNEQRATIFDANGSIIRADFALMEESGGAGSGAGNEADIAGLTNGGFAVSFYNTTTRPGSGTTFDILVAFFDAAGNAVGLPVQVYAGTNGVPDHTAITQLEDGKVLITWEAQAPDPGVDRLTNVYGRLFDMAGRPAGAQFELAQRTFGEQQGARIAALAGGGFVATWRSESIDGDSFGISARTFGRGTAGDDTLTVDVTGSMAGLSGHDDLAGDRRGNVLNGGTGDDTLAGGLGNDRLIGSTGADLFVFDTVPNAARNTDTIVGFRANDTIALDHTIFAGLGAVGALDPALFNTLGPGRLAEADDRILYDTVSGTLYHDANGSAPGQRVAIAVLAGAPMLAAGDFLVI